MHIYNVEGKRRLKLYLSLFTLSVAFYFVAEKYIEKWSFLSWLEENHFLTFSAVSFSTLFIWLYDKYFWKLFSVSNFKNFTGIYSGHILFLDDRIETQIEATLIIKQTFTEIAISLNTEDTNSQSYMSAIKGNGASTNLVFAYIVEDISKNKDNYLREGLTSLFFDPKADSRVLRGSYYAPNGRNGRLEFNKVN